jgi:DNA invertase Pin-like site-specific DNA recombinase
MSHIAIYARKSTESEDRQILSIESQVKELRDFAKNQNLIIERVFTESKSAKAPGRPIFSEILGHVQKGKLDEILCWKLDRLARNPVDGGALIWAMEEKKLMNIHTPQRTFVNTGNDKFWMQLEFGMAKKYIDDLSDNVKRGQRARANLGWCPGLPPLGYVIEKSSKAIVRDAERFPLLRKMWDLMLTGRYSPRAIVTIATNQLGLRTRLFKRMGGGPVAYSAIYKMFSNPYYYGVFRYGGQEYRGAHPAMVTKSEFDRVQELLGLKDRPRPRLYSFPYTGLIKCGECGASITAEHKINRQGHKYIYYHCSKRKRAVHCSQKVIEGKALEKQIVTFLDSITISREFKDWAVRIIKRMHSEECEKSEARISALRKRSDACKKEMSELLNMKLRGLLDDAEYAVKKNELLNELTTTKEFIDDSDNRYEQVLQCCEDAFDFTSMAKRVFEFGSHDQRRAILGYVGSNLVLMNGNLRIEAKKPIDFIIKATRSLPSKIDRFEPVKLGESYNQKQRPHAVFDKIWGLVDEVRTFYRENRANLDSLKLPDILHSSRN